MPEKTFKLEIVTPERIVLQTDIASLVAPGVDGALGILANHAPLMAELTTGELWMRDAEGNEICGAISGGFMEVIQNHVRILADTAELACDIDVERAEAARRRAQERLAHAENVDRARAEASLKRAASRIRAARGG